MVAPKKIFVSQELRKRYDFLDNKRHREWIDNMKKSLLENMLSGDKIRKNQIPKKYMRKYNLTNLYRFSHPDGYRSLYSIMFFGEDGFCPVILDFLSQKKYENVFGYHGSF